MNPLFSGAGPGSQTRDGSSVLMYRDLPYRGELEELRTFLAPGVSVLDLGCGTGRLTRRLLELGCEVTAVDQSAEMLDEVPDRASRVHSDIETLALGRKFDVVLLASGLINHPSGRVREALLDAAGRHLPLGGRFLCQSQNPQWLRTAQVGPVGTSDGGLATRVETVTRANDTVEMKLRYDLRGSTWYQSFTVVALDESQIEEALATAGFSEFSWVGAQRRWVCAVASQAVAKPASSIGRLF